MKKVILAVIGLFAFAFSANAQVNNFSVGDVCPDFTVTDVHGASHSLYDITASGQYVLLDFFFTTCGPCQATAPFFSELHETYGCNTGQLFCLSIDQGDTDAQVIDFENTYGGNFASPPAASGSAGGGNAVNATFGIAAYPTYTLIGPDNRFINTDIWPISSMADFVAAFPSGSNINPQSCAVAIDDPAAGLSVQLYPNPATNSTRLAMDFAEFGNVSVSVYDVLGKRVIDMNLGTVDMGTKVVDLDLAELNEGIYFVQIAQNDKVLTTEKLNVLR